MPLNSKILKMWKKVMGDDEPYDLGDKASLVDNTGCAMVTCIVCSNPIESPW
jgi:hypothetical protein